MTEDDTGDGFGSEHRMIIEQVRDQIDPGAAERKAMRQVTAQLRSRITTEIESLPVDADIIQVGSTARGTWLAGDRDIDMFVRFPADLDREVLEEYGLTIGNAVLPSGDEEYAEHPYVTGTFEGFEVDLVPCYDVDAGSELQSAVDRTPHHNRYLQTRIGESTAAAVRVLKQFLKGIGAYGSDLRTRGFSGYLTELLVVEYGDFEGVLKTAAKWEPPIEIDPKAHGSAAHDDPLVVVDPTDPTRNVAAVCSATNISRLQHYARQFLEEPAQTYFTSPTETTAKMDSEVVRTHLQRRGTSPVAVVFDSPDIVDDQLYPQLRKSIQGIRTALEAEGFDVIRTATFADDQAVLFIELMHRHCPAIERHTGPPIAVREHASEFYTAYESDTHTYGPFIDDDRYVVERERTWTDAAAFLRSEAIFDVGLGAQIEEALADTYTVLIEDDITALTPEFGESLTRYFEPTA
ncbi:MAG: CCA-adding enzyme [Haloquadratum walsbyi J07HQW1]|uniref:CCA-adding enzyme n=1 Tax=Haloquadratum walsbyi J07HQW1 TaxID=1238424 RepID=U1N2D3_9EURY|nr:MAG: CCA-adding enzyme [Haloquadratum walsbyi J07HQW1]